MDEPKLWSDVEVRLQGRERGARSELARLLRMDRSFLARKLRTADELTVSQARVISAWLDGRETPEPPPSAGSRNRLPVYGYAAAAADEDRFIFRDGAVLEEIDLPMGLSVGPGDYFGVYAPGSSMEPRAFAGELHVVRRGWPPGRDKKCVVEFNDGTAVLKTYRGQHSGRVFAEQYNPPRTLDYDASSVKAVHAVAFSI